MAHEMDSVMVPYAIFRKQELATKLISLELRKAIKKCFENVMNKIETSIRERASRPSNQNHKTKSAKYNSIKRPNVDGPS